MPNALRGAWAVGLHRWHWPCAVLLWLAALCWLRPLSDPDEGRYATVALAMLHSGDWVTPYLNGLPFFHKPPLYYWIAAGGFRLFGVHAWVARLPSLLGALLAALSLYTLLHITMGRATARASVAIFVTMPFVYLAAQYANMDMLLAGCVSACIASAALSAWAFDQGRAWRGWLLAAALFAGLGFLAKGLIGVVLPGMAWCGWVLADRRYRRLRILLYPMAWLVAVVVTVPWLWLALAQLRYSAFLHYFFVTQHFQRYTSKGFNNPQPWWFYPAVIMLACMPWTAMAGVARYQQWRAASSPAWPVPPTQQLRLPSLRSVDRLMLVWLGVVLVFFSLPQSKIVGYVLPALPPLAYGIARQLGCGSNAIDPTVVQAPRGLVARTVAAGVVCAGLALALGSVAVPADNRWQLLAGLQVQPTDRLVMLRHMYYELPFYLQTARPALVVDDWAAAQKSTKDNWRKELTDAAAMDPQQAQQLLLSPAQLHAYALAPGERLWVVGDSASAAALWPALAHQAPVRRVGATTVWLLDALD